MVSCTIQCTDKMIVGRWYKLVTYPVGYDTVPYNYKVYYTVSNDAICALVFDTIYIKKPGIFIVDVTDMYGNTDKKVINAIPEPEIARRKYIYQPASWDDLMLYIADCGENAYISVIKSKYDFDIYDSTNKCNIPKNTIIDFNNSVIKITSAASTYRMFYIVNDNSGIVNANFIGGDGLREYEHSEQSMLIVVNNGYNCLLKNLYFDMVNGFNIGIGNWNYFWDFKPSVTSTRWRLSNAESAYVGSDGNLVASNEAYASTDFISCTKTEDNSYVVGIRSLYIPTIVRVYDIAFYDSDYNFIELRKNQQYYRKYYLPENAAYWKCAVFQATEPKESTGGDDYCIFRMYGDGLGIGSANSVQDMLVDNVRADDNESGVLSVIGICEDLHLNRIRCDSNGKVNSWAFDVEDSWNGCCGMVMTHSSFLGGKLNIYGAQGASVISCIFNCLVTNYNLHFATIINCICKHYYIYSIRGYVVISNSYFESIKNSATDEDGNSLTEYETNPLSSTAWDDMLSVINKYYYKSYKSNLL